MRIKKSYFWGLYSFEKQFGGDSETISTVKIVADTGQAQAAMENLTRSSREMLAAFEEAERVALRIKDMAATTH